MYAYDLVSFVYARPTSFTPHLLRPNFLVLYHRILHFFLRPSTLQLADRLSFFALKVPNLHYFYHLRVPSFTAFSLRLSA